MARSTKQFHQDRSIGHGHTNHCGLKTGILTWDLSAVFDTLDTDLVVKQIEICICKPKGSFTLSPQPTHTPYTCMQPAMYVTDKFQKWMLDFVEDFL